MDLPKFSEDTLHLMEPLTASEDIKQQKGRIFITSLRWTDNLIIIIIETLKNVQKFVEDFIEEVDRVEEFYLKNLDDLI